MASRPMFRGHGGGDDLSSIVDEEIVATEVGGESDIYAASNSASTEESLSGEEEAPLAVDHTCIHGVIDAAPQVVVADGEDILSLAEEDDMGENYLSLVKPKPRAEEPREPEIVFDLASEPELDFDVALDLESGAEPDFDISLDLGSEPEPDFDISLDLELDLTRVAGTEPDSDLTLVEEPGLETVVDYIASMPAPVDDGEFDQYLLDGQKLEGAEDDSDALHVERTEGVASVDPVVSGSIDYHEDFQMCDGSMENTVSVITGVIAQVMDEVMASVEERLLELGVDAGPARVEVMLGNDVESIIECVTDGYAPIVEIRPDLPAALRQLGQTEVDAIFVRISHCRQLECPVWRWFCGAR